MKILLIMPDAHMHKLRLGSYVKSMREMPLSLCTLAALTPGHPDIDIRLVDGSVETVPLDYPADLVGISVITGCANGAYSIADAYRARKIPVVLGGIHATILPGEAMLHADAVVVGRAEKSWPRLVEDFRRGAMKKAYFEDPLEGDVLSGVPPPRRDLHDSRRYIMPNSIQATRGCLRDCDFCTVTAVWPKYLRRPIGDVIRDIREVPGKYISFNDVSLAEDPEYSKELFKAMIPLGKKWGGLVTVDALADSELVSLMAECGCKYLLLGFETGDEAVLRQIHKGFNRPPNYKTLIEGVHSLGISVQGCFVFGFDHDDKRVFRRTVDLADDLKIDIPRYSLYTPYPGTRLFKRLLDEGRILSFNWDDYDTMHVVIRPAQMTPDELYDGFKWAYRESFRLGRIARRLRGDALNIVINALGNLTYRVFVRRLYREKRFAAPYSRWNPCAPPEARLYGMIPADDALCPN